MGIFKFLFPGLTRLAAKREAGAIDSHNIYKIFIRLISYFF